MPGAAAYSCALERAYADAGVDPATDRLSGGQRQRHSAEDRMEAAALASFFGSRMDHRRSCAVASVKGEIGHCGAASGLASFVRGCLALYQEIIPPLAAGLETPLAELADAGPLLSPPRPTLLAAQPRRRPTPRRGQRLRRRRHLQPCGPRRMGQALPQSEPERLAPLGTGTEFLFTLAGGNPCGTVQGLETAAPHGPSRHAVRTSPPWPGTGTTAGRGASRQTARHRPGRPGPARSSPRSSTRGEPPPQRLAADRPPTPLPPRSLRDRLFYSPAPLGRDGKIAFVFPGSGNHFPGMGMELSSRWPEIFRRQDAENLYLREPVPAGALLERRPCSRSSTTTTGR